MSKDKEQRKESINTDSAPAFINRELSLLEFQKRVLAQALDPGTPLLERLRFLTIACANLDEFFEIRVAALKEQIEVGLSTAGPDGFSPQETLRQIREKVLALVAEQYRVLNDVLLPELAERGIVLFTRQKQTPEIQEWMREYFVREVLPVMTPVGLDPAHPFPRVLNKSLNFILTLDGKDAFGRKSGTAIVQAPRILPRLIAVPVELAKVPFGFVMLSSVIQATVAELFPGMKVLSSHQFRVTRDSDLWVDEEDVEDLLSALKGGLPRRHYGNAVRVEISSDMPAEISRFLQDQFQLSESDVYKVDGPVNLHRLEEIYKLADRPDLKYPPFIPGLPKKVNNSSDIFGLLRERDLLLHHPYQGFAPVLDLARQAARDPDVLAIKQTVYRTGINSPLGEALLEAAEQGKEVTAVVELRARFDEAANIELASRLQEAGARVVYGVVGFKAHAKMLMVVRREGGRLRRYVHLGTGNYNTKTALAYTDISLLTSRDDFGEDVHALFQQLTGLGRVRQLKKLIQTPFGLHDRLLELIGKEASAARDGKKARIIAKMNALVEPDIIRALYTASQAGVSIDLIVRGTCCLRPGIPGLSENIRVRSIVDRFLEHHRICYFHAQGEELVYCGSADWMPRNFFTRVELCFPIEGEKHRRRILSEGLDPYLEDNCSAWEMRSDGTYQRVQPGSGQRYCAQERLLESLAKLSP
ncbi:MAG: polyphosphate kinase 1 [Planctomycetota bacterium]